MQSAPQIAAGDRGKLLFKAPDDLVMRKISWPKQDDPRAQKLFELRAGPVQDVLPPSIHPDTGRPYAGKGGQSDGLPEVVQFLTIWREWDTFRPQMMSMGPWISREPCPAPKQRVQSDGPSVIDAFNHAYNIRTLLIQYGYKQTGQDRFLSPNSTTKLAGCVVLDNNQACSHHQSDPFGLNKDGNPYAFDCFELYCQYEHQAM